jgi:hypothetical protein
MLASKCAPGLHLRRPGSLSLQNGTPIHWASFSRYRASTDASVELIAISGMPPASLSTPPPDLNICFDQGSHAKIVIALVGDG